MSIEMTGIKEPDNSSHAEANKIDPGEFDKRIEPDKIKHDDIESVPHRIGNFDNPTHIETNNAGLENDVHPITGVPFERRIIETPSGEVIEGVFPKFETSFQAKLPESMYLDSNRTQFKECNKQLYEKIENDPELRKQFTEEQIDQIRDGINDGSAPDGYVWHHEPESGVLSLVDSYTHSHTHHTGGRFIWGGALLLA